MENKTSRITLKDVLLLILSAVYVVGISTFFKPCGPKDDGSWMTCHWAGKAVLAFAIVILVFSIIRFFFADSKIKIGLSIATIPTAILSALIPGVFINLCRMETMRCRAITRPSVIVISVLIVVIAIIDVVSSFSKIKKAS